jgi:hypothetical protein
MGLIFPFRTPGFTSPLTQQRAEQPNHHIATLHDTGVAPRDFAPADERATIESLLATKKLNGPPPARPPRPMSLFRDTKDESSPEPPIPDYLAQSGISHVDELPLWVRMMDARHGPVLNVGDMLRGGLGSHPVRPEDYRPEDYLPRVKERGKGLERQIDGLDKRKAEEGKGRESG